jgi:mannan endo-1,4-beta-mannosidase
MNRRQYLRAAGSTVLLGAGVASLQYGNDEMYDGVIRPLRAALSSSPRPGVSPDDIREALDRESAEPNTDEPAEATPVPPDPGAREGTTLLGVFPPFEQGFATLDAYEAWLGNRSAAVAVVADMLVPRATIDLVMEGLTTIWGRGSVPVLILQPMFQQPAETTPLVDRQIANGAHDDTLDAWGRALARWLLPESGPERRLFLDFAPEMNGDWSPWGGEDDPTGPASYVAMWRRVRRRLTRRGVTADHLQWIWAPNTIYYGQKHPLASYYPGDRYVDWLGMHGYNWGESFDWAEWLNPEVTYGKTLDALRQIADKPIAITEVGSSSHLDGGFRTGRKAEWITTFGAYVQNEDIKLVCWFNMDKRTDWAVFGGRRGTDSFQYAGRRYACYESYRAVVSAPGFLSAHPSYPRLLSSEEFQGQF